MFILRDEKIVKKIKDYDKDLQNINDYVYTVIVGGLKKINIAIWIILVILLAIILDVITNNPAISGGIIGGFVGGSLAFKNDFCVLIMGDKHLNLYIFNKLMSKVISKIELPYNEFEIEKIKQGSFWNTVKIKTKVKHLEFTMSKKTLGLKNQTANVSKLIEYLEKQFK